MGSKWRRRGGAAGASTLTEEILGLCMSGRFGVREAVARARAKKRKNVGQPWPDDQHGGPRKPPPKS
jgi:hypothetical protein